LRSTGIARALPARYGLPEQAAGFFRFFADSQPGFAGRRHLVL
jgi:hypothetical protein